MRPALTILLVFILVNRSQAQVQTGMPESMFSMQVKRVAHSPDSALTKDFIVQTTNLEKAEDLLLFKGKSASIRGRFVPSGVIVLRMPLAQIIEILGKHNLIRFIDISRKPNEESHIEGYDYTSNRLNQMRVEYPSINGYGLTVSVKEQRFDTNDIDFKGRIKSSGLEADRITTHASQMGTMIAGGGNSSDFSRGAAWGARLVSSSFETLLPDPIGSYRSSEVSVQNHSYGTGIENYYGADALSYDESVRQLPYLLHVFSAGNSGEQASAEGPYAGVSGFANITGSFKMAKNVLVVGATDSASHVESRSSRGPAYDGRIKPDLVAFGHDGSSGAAAIVSGIALVVQQAYRQKEGSLPPASLTRAVLVNTADDLDAPGPDFTTGYGAANGMKALRAVDSGWYFSGTASTGSPAYFSIPVPPGAINLKIMICWTDPPAQANAVQALVNDLDLSVASPSGMVFLPLIPNPGRASLSSPAVNGRDSLNNIEQVVISAPEPGIYRVSTTGRSITGLNQPFSVTYFYEKKNHFEWNFPARNDQLRSGARSLLRWNTDLSGPGILWVRKDSAASWQKILTVDHSDTGNVEWYPEPGFYMAQLKFSTSGNDYLSAPFQVSAPLQSRVVLNCKDSSIITWYRETAVARYTVYGLKDGYMTPVGQTTDSFFVVHNEVGNFVAVAPIIGDTTGQRGFTVNVNTQGAGCYASNLLADLQPSGSVKIRFDAGTLYEVSGIALEKSNGATYTEIARVNNPSKLSYEWIDALVKQGISFYRIRIELTGNRTVYSVVVQVSNPGNNGFLFFPNPVSAMSEFSVLSANTDDAVLVVYDLYGRVVFRKQLLEQIERVALRKSGVYFYQVLVAGKQSKSGKLIVQ